jgi:hypothetical protein
MAPTGKAEEPYFFLYEILDMPVMKDSMNGQRCQGRRANWLAAKNGKKKTLEREAEGKD